MIIETICTFVINNAINMMQIIEPEGEPLLTGSES